MVGRFGKTRKAGYASVEMGVTAFELMLQVYLLEFYIRSCGLNPLLASAGAVIAVLWDAVSDPLMGQISDSTGSKWFGKRGGYILLGSVCLGITGTAIFNPPDDLSQKMLFSWFLLSYLAVNTSMTVVSVPHIACVGDFASEGKDRNSFFGWRLLFSNLGLLMGIVLPTVLVNGDEYAGRSLASYGIAFVLMLNAGICILSIRTLDQVKPVPKVRITLVEILRTMVSAFQNRYFIPLILSFSLAAIGRALNSGFALFYYKDVLSLDEKTQVSGILIVFIFSMIAGIPFWLALGERFWKKRPAFLGIFSLGLLTCVTYPFFPPGSISAPLLMAVIGGVAVGAILLIESLVLDTVDYDESITGLRRDGVYFGCWKMASKVARAIGIALTGPLLVWSGYDQTELLQESITRDRIGWIFGVGVGCFFLLSSGVFLLFRMNRKMHQELIGK